MATLALLFRPSITPLDEATVLQTPLHDVPDGVEDFLPSAMEGRCGLLLGELSRPMREKQHVGLAQRVLAKRTSTPLAASSIVS